MAPAAPSAEKVGLAYVTSEAPGITRRRSGSGFSYRDPHDKLIRDKDALARIKSLAIPPAWTDVWICPDEHGHLQATGRDARGRKQHRYHPRFREVRDAAKFERLTEFAKALPALRARIDEDMGLRGLPREKVLATIAHLLDTTLIRVGNDEYAKTNKSYGLTTLKDQHAKVRGDTLRFVFTGKSGKSWKLTMKNRRVAKVVKAAQELPGQRLFQYVDEDGTPQSVTSTDVNAYLREISGAEVTAKDFRTWGGTVLAAAELSRLGAFDTQTLAKANVKAAIETVSMSLGNTPTICRKCYVHPELLDTYLAGGFKLPRSKHAGLSAHEAAVLAFLDRRPRRRNGKSQTPRPTSRPPPARAPAVQEVSAN
ncbi:MAG TPA: DNA topoisomerase IB [Candidatus Binatia bacterium]|nr:DNA topoisomerase IB [Candidatus Binatia bacterium]